MKALLVLSAVDRMNTQAYPPFPNQGEPLRSNLWKFDGRNGGWTRGNPDRCRSLTQEKNSWVLDGMYRLYAKLPNPIGRPLGHAAGDSDGVSAVMKEMVLKTLQRIPPLFDEAFRDLGMPGMARVKANLFVNTWQGAIVVAWAGEGLEHIGRVFRYLKRDRPSCLLKSRRVGLARFVVEL